MSDIILSSAVRSNLTSLQQTADLIAQTQTRLSTGKRVNSALDNPINFFTSQSLSSRASDLSNLLDSVGNATQTLQAANNGITSLTKLVQSAQSIAQQAQQSAATTGKYTGTVAGLTGTSDWHLHGGQHDHRQRRHDHRDLHGGRHRHGAELPRRGEQHGEP